MSKLVWATPLLVLLAPLPGGRLLLPLLAPLALYPAFVRRVRQSDHFGAWRLGVMGAALVGYMSYFVASFARAVALAGAVSKGGAVGAAGFWHGGLAALAAWVPWSVVRVLAFVCWPTS